MPQPPAGPPPGRPSQRQDQRERTRAALVEGTRALIRSGGEVTMPGIARAAGVSEPTAYRYFPDLLSVITEAFAAFFPDAGAVMPSQAECPDPVDRTVFAARAHARHVLRYEGAIRAVIALTIARPDKAGLRLAPRTGLIESALAPLAGRDSARLAQLEHELSLVISPEALFSLLDLSRLTREAAVTCLEEAARSLVRAALADFADRER